MDQSTQDQLNDLQQRSIQIKMQPTEQENLKNNFFDSVEATPPSDALATTLLLIWKKTKYYLITGVMTSIAKMGSTALKGAVTLTASGSNSLNQVGQNIDIVGNGLSTAYDYQEFTTPGTTNWVKPAGATAHSMVIIHMWGAGGGGGGALQTGDFSNAGSGAGAEFVEITVRASDLGSTTPVFIATGGPGGIGAQNGTDGTNSNFNTSQFIARGGQGGHQNHSPTFIASGGGYFPGTTNGQSALDSFSGGAGAQNGGSTTGGSAFRGGPAGASNGGTPGTNAFGWSGGTGPSGNGNGQDAPNPASGGGGATQNGGSGTRTGGKGGNGLCRIWTIL